MSASLLRLARRHVSAVSSRTTAVSTRAFSHTPAPHADPWLLPNTPEHVAKTTSPPDAPAPQPLARPGEDVERTRARLVYQSRKRGTLEADLLLSTFAAERLGGMGAEELQEFDKLMDEPDWDIYYWATEKKEPPARWANSAILEQLRVHVKNEGRVVRRMPDLS